jgi:hypothetical protein
MPRQPSSIAGVTVVNRRLLGIACVCALASCSKRPLGEEDDGGMAIDVGLPGQGGQTGTGCGSGAPGLELVGTTLTALDQPATNVSLYTSLLWTGDEYLFIWRLFAGADVLMQRIDANGTAVGGNIRVRAYESGLDVAWGGARLAAVWARKNGTDGRIMFQTFDALGRPLTDEATLRASVGIAIDGSVVYGPRIAPIGDRFVIVWTERTNQIFVATVGFDGQLLQGPVLAGGSDLNSSPILGLAAGADRFVVGWNGTPPATSPPTPTWQNLTVARAFSGDLAPLGDANVLDAAAFASAPQVLATTDEFLVLWTHGVPFDPMTLPSDAEVRIAQLDGAGASTTTSRLDQPAGGPYRSLSPAAWNGDHLVLVWNGRLAGDTGLTLTRFTATGERQGQSIDLPTATPPGAFDLIAHDGTLAFTWTERFGAGYQVYFQQARSCP